ncbi:MAG TPA: haloacid dehalogenase type II [Rubrivivax sp.]|nr:haloacid dehalogenase type II [Pseudomonadota bacterium]MCW5639138.1 haloacid dehalogenase type II [Rubrivivax sp.]HRZ62689.1 haloacid dehalogenase type II [Rubrivivax sp.]
MVMPRPRPHALPRAVLFDAYGTLFDVHSVALLAEQLFPGQGERLSLLWRERQIDYTRLLTMSGRYRPFWEVTRAALRFAALRLALPLDAAGEDRLMNQYRHLSAFPEARDVLAALHRAAVPAGILSNGDPDMLAVAVKSAGFAAWLDPLLSVHAVQRYKTDAAAYALGPQALRLAARDILFVSSNGWDAIGATWYGYTTLWVNRNGAPLEQLDCEPSHTGTSLRAVLDLLLPVKA